MPEPEPWHPDGVRHTAHSDERGGKKKQGIFSVRQADTDSSMMIREKVGFSPWDTIKICRDLRATGLHSAVSS